jgi:hypothetical protein
MAMPEPPAPFGKGGPVAEWAVTETPEGRRQGLSRAYPSPAPREKAAFA